MTMTMTMTEGPDQAERPLALALRRGWQGRCPNCGAGTMMRSYLKVRDKCPVCGQALHHHRAVDGPAYVTILLEGHLLAPIIYYVFVKYRPEPMVLASIFTTATVVLALFLLPRFKGMFVAMQWAKRMYGFGAEETLPEHD